MVAATPTRPVPGAARQGKVFPRLERNTNDPRHITHRPPLRRLLDLPHRRRERRADWRSYDTVAEAETDRRGVVRFFERLDKGRNPFT